jgi:hypothetical protein
MEMPWLVAGAFIDRQFILPKIRFVKMLFRRGARFGTLQSEGIRKTCDFHSGAQRSA